MADPSNSPITTSTLSEAASKDLVEQYGVPLAAEHIVPDAESAVAAAVQIGGAVAVKLNGDTIAHKTERGLVRLSHTLQCHHHFLGCMHSICMRRDGTVGVLKT